MANARVANFLESQTGILPYQMAPPPQIYVCVCKLYTYVLLISYKTF